MPTSEYLRGARIVVIGAGAIGAVLSYRLAQAGAAVTTIERRHPGAGTTGSTFAYVNGTDKPPRDYHRLSMLAIRDHEDLEDELGGGWLHVTGSLHWADARDPGRSAALDQVMRRLAGWGTRVDRLTPEQAVRELEPDLAIDPATAGPVYFVSRAGWLDPIALAHGTMQAAIERYGAQWLRDEVVALPSPAGMIQHVALAGGRQLMADVVVNAAGPEAGRVAALAGASLPLQAIPGVLLVTGPAPVRLHRVVYAPAVNVRPDGGCRVLVQWEALDSRITTREPLRLGDPLVGEGLGLAAQVVPALATSEIEAVRSGVRPVPRDGLPLVGFDPAVGNLYHVVTHSGITLAARLARLVTEELSGGDAAPLEPYRPDRAGAVRG